MTAINPEIMMGAGLTNQLDVAAINKNKSSVKHDVFLKDEQKEMQRIMNKEVLDRRQQEIVDQNGRDMAADTQNELAE